MKSILFPLKHKIKIRMMNTRSKVSPLPRSKWNMENKLIDDSHLSIHVQSARSWEMPSEENFSSNKNTQLIKQDDKPKLDLNAEEQDHPNRQRIIAVYLGLALLCIAMIVLPIVLLNTVAASTASTTTSAIATISATPSTRTTSRVTTTSTTTTTTPSCGSTCVTVSTLTTSRLAFYSFDSNTNDATGVYPASGIASPTYTTGYVNMGIYFNATLSQRLSTSPMSLNSRSFTIEFWFSLVNAAGNTYAFFGQMSVMNTPNQCLFLAALSGQLDIGFFNNDATSLTVLQSNTWYHAAFVYDHNVRQQNIYINGILDKQSPTSISPYLGTSGPMTIGGADIYGALGVPYLSGTMDHLTISTRAKTACEILNDATLAAYFPFDGSLTDAGPNFLTATASGASATTGYVNQGVYLSGTNSYVQISSLTGLGQSNQSFSFAFWMYPIIPGVLVHVHTISNGLGWCTPFMGISSTGNIIVQVYRTAAPYIITGPVIPLNTWTHIVQTYSPTNGQSLYINGILYLTLSNATIYTASGVQNFVTIGNILSGGCYNPGILQTPIQGVIDELRIYSRELSSTDVCLLVWP